MTTESRARVAKKAHKCAYAQHEIKPGERYWDEVHPPWTLIHDDPDTPSTLGTWEHVRFHGYCQQDSWYA